MDTQVVRTQLGTKERNHVWRSSLNGALYRWSEDGWEVRFDSAPDWHLVRSGRVTQTLFSHAGEHFIAEDSDGG